MSIRASQKQKTHSFEWVGFSIVFAQPTRRDSGAKVPEPKSKRDGREHQGNRLPQHRRKWLAPPRADRSLFPGVFPLTSRRISWHTNAVLGCQSVGPLANPASSTSPARLSVGS